MILILMVKPLLNALFLSAADLWGRKLAALLILHTELCELHELRFLWCFVLFHLVVTSPLL